MTVTEYAEKRVIEIKHEIADLERRLSEYEQAMKCVKSQEVLEEIESTRNEIESDLRRAEKTLLYLKININLGCDPVSYVNVTEPLEWGGKYKARFAITYISQHTEVYYIDEDVFWMFAPFFQLNVTRSHVYSLNMDRVKGYLS